MSLGIDFGTTRTVVAHADRGNYPVLSFTDDAGDAWEWFPSVVAERRGELRFGFDALVAAADPSFTVVRSFKRLLSEADAVPDRKVRIGGSEIALGDLVTRFASALRDALRTRSNLEGELPTRAVIAVPANAHGGQRFVTIDAFRRAGFDVMAMLNEPSAAGFEYTHRHRKTLNSKRDHVLVYDLGGGTFDTSLVAMRELEHEVVATAGLGKLGGDDFDILLADLFIEREGIAKSALTPAVWARLVEHCRDAKERLNPASRKITIDLEAAGVGVGQGVLEVQAFYEACTPLVRQTLAAMEPVLEASDAVDAIAGVYVVGGASELPIVSRVLKERFGRRVHRSPYASGAVAIGLAIASDARAGFALTDRLSRVFGVFREGDDGRAITFDPIFGTDTILPRAESGVNPARRTCVRAYRAAHNVGHFRFFECSAVGADGRPRGDLTLFHDVLFPFDRGLAGRELGGVAVERLGDGPRVEEEYTLDENGIVEVTIRNVDGGYAEVYRVGSAA